MYSDTHVYDLTVSGLSGHLYFSNSHPVVPGLTGSFDVEIYAANEKVDFAVTQSAHHVLPGRHGAFVVTTTKGVGQLVVPPPPANGESVASTSETGGLSFSELKLSPRDVLLLTEDKLSLKVTSGSRFLPATPGQASTLFLTVSVSKSANTHTCPLGTKGLVSLKDGASLHEPDAVRFTIPDCNLNVAYTDGKLGAKVAVAIKVE